MLAYSGNVAAQMHNTDAGVTQLVCHKLSIRYPGFELLWLVLIRSFFRWFGVFIGRLCRFSNEDRKGNNDGVDNSKH